MPFLFDGTLLSVLLCILAGITLRYALFHEGGKRTGIPPELNPSLADREREWKERSLALHDALEREQLRHASLMRTSEQMQARLRQLEQVSRPDPVPSTSETVTDSELQVQLHDVLKDRSRLQEALRGSEAAIARLIADAHFAKDLREQHVDLQHITRDLTDQCRTLTEERDAWESRCHEAHRFLDEVRSENFGWQLRDKSQRDQLTTLESRLEDACRREATLQNEGIELRAIVAPLDEMTVQLADLQSQAAEWPIERARLEWTVEQSRQRTADLEADVQRLESRLGRQETLLRELRIEKEEALTHLEREYNAKVALEAKLRVNTEALQRLRSDSRSLESLLERQVALQMSLHEHAERLQSPTSDSVPPAVAEAPSAEPATAPRILAFPRDDHSPAPPAEGLVFDRDRGWIFAFIPPRRDDLRRISGIGEIIERRLNELGVYTFHQIQLWNAPQVEVFSRQLGFRDRIEREQWVEQARRLYRECQGEAA